MFKIAVLISGSGTNLQAIIDAIEDNYLSNCKIEYVISDRVNAYGIERAQKYGIKAFVLNRKKYKEGLSDEILKILHEKVDLIVCAGYLSILNGEIIEKFKNRIINIHPSLIPSFCGKGMYGIKVHEFAIEYGVRVTGCTVHFIDENTDTGAIIIQKIVEVLPQYNAIELQKKVLVKEHEALTEAIKLISEGRVRLKGRRVFFIK